MCLTKNKYGSQVPLDVWHIVEVHDPVSSSRQRMKIREKEQGISQKRNALLLKLLFFSYTFEWCAVLLDIYKTSCNGVTFDILLRFGIIGLTTLSYHSITMSISTRWICCHNKHLLSVLGFRHCCLNT